MINDASKSYPDVTVRLPNFLIVGAAKAGTTSLYYYLRQHPDIYLPDKKEPKFITSGFLSLPHQGPGEPGWSNSAVKDYHSYTDLFRQTKNEKAIGEASADSLYYYEKAIPRIKELLGDVKIIIILRDPAERAFSAYSFMNRAGYEDLSFSEALAAEAEKMRNNWDFIYFYKDVSLYFKQVKAYLENFSRVKICFFEDLGSRREDLIKELFRFLEVDDAFKVDISKAYNVTPIQRVPKSRIIHALNSGDNAMARAFRYAVKCLLKKPSRDKIKEFIKKNLYAKPKPDDGTIRVLTEYFAEDINNLSQLLKKDLRSWLGK